MAILQLMRVVALRIQACYRPNMNSIDVITMRYARALYLAAKEQNILPIITTQLKALDEAFAKNHQQDSLDITIIHSLVEHLNNKVHPLLKNTFSILEKNNRLSLLPGFYTAWQKISHHPVRAIITTAAPLNDVEKQDIQKLIHQKAQQQYSNKDINLYLEFKVNEAVLSGVAIQIDGTLIDNTWRHKLEQLKLSLQAAA